MLTDLERRLLEEFGDDIGAPAGLVAERTGVSTAQVTRTAKKLAAEGLLEDTGWAMKKTARAGWQWIDNPKTEGGMISKPGASTVWKTTDAGYTALAGTAQETTMTHSERRLGFAAMRETKEPHQVTEEYRHPPGSNWPDYRAAVVDYVRHYGNQSKAEGERIVSRYEEEVRARYKNHEPADDVARLVWDRWQNEDLRETHQVADFNSLDDLIAHAHHELGATHVVVAGAHTQIFFPRGGQYPYEAAKVWRKGGYWHAEGPGARTGVKTLPKDAQPIEVEGGGQRAAETRVDESGVNFQDGERVRIRVIGPQGQLTDPPFWYTVTGVMSVEDIALQFTQTIQPGMFVSISDGKNSWTFQKETHAGQNAIRRTHKLPTARYREAGAPAPRGKRPTAPKAKRR